MSHSRSLTRRIFPSLEIAESILEALIESWQSKASSRRPERTRKVAKLRPKCMLISSSFASFPVSYSRPFCALSYCFPPPFLFLSSFLSSSLLLSPEITSGRVQITNSLKRVKRPCPYLIHYFLTRKKFVHIICILFFPPFLRCVCISPGVDHKKNKSYQKKMKNKNTKKKKWINSFWKLDIHLRNAD